MKQCFLLLCEKQCRINCCNCFTNWRTNWCSWCKLLTALFGRKQTDCTTQKVFKSSKNKNIQLKPEVKGFHHTNIEITGRIKHIQICCNKNTYGYLH